MKYLLGLDLGSGSVKATLIDLHGYCVAVSANEYATYYPQDGWAEQEPEEWYNAAVRTIRGLLAASRVNPGDIAALAADAATHTAVLLASGDKPLRRATFLTDQRRASQASWLNGHYGDILRQQTCNTATSVWTLPQLMWLKENEPDILTRTRLVLFAKDYLRFRLTGDRSTDRIDAMGSLFYDTEAQNWSTVLGALTGLAEDCYPTVREPTDLAGFITAEASAATGLAAGTAVITGTTDTAMELVAAGAVCPGQSAVKLATAGRFYHISDYPCPNPYLINYQHIIHGTWYPGAATKASASSFRWYRDTFARDIPLSSGQSSYNLLDKAAAAIKPGCAGLFFHPYLLGELTPYNDASLRGSFVGVTMRHTQAHFTRAVLEGVAFSLRDCYAVLAKEGLAPDDARIIGGGAASPLWRGIVADILGIPLDKPENDDSSFGAALIAGVGCGLFPSVQAAVARCVRMASRTEPDPARHKQYEPYYRYYQTIHDVLAPVYRQDYPVT
ncbi:MAG: xylulokinase [Ruminococcaceae bacterium]|nr:xylulokinase [Oscillospiraceae bacterium]